MGLSYRAIGRLKSLAGNRVTAAGEIHFSADTERGQEGNRAESLRPAELIVAAKVEPKVRKKTKPSRAAKKRRLDQKRRRSEVKAGRRGSGRIETFGFLQRLDWHNCHAEDPEASGPGVMTARSFACLSG